MPNDSTIWTAATGGLVIMVGSIVFICTYVLIFALVIDTWRMMRNEHECICNMTV